MSQSIVSTTIGNTVTLEGDFTYLQAPAQPDSVLVQVWRNGQLYAEDSFPSGAVANPSSGKFTLRVLCRAPGTYTCLFIGNGSKIGRGTGAWLVRPDVFPQA